MKKKLKLIQASRAIVPLLVAIVHISGTMRVKYDYNFLGLSDLPKSGGVDYFFVLTGFMMFYVYQNYFGDKKFYRIFLYNRIIRLYPFYWVIAIPLIPFLYIVPSLESDRDIGLSNVLKSLFLFPQELGPFIFVAWSLSFNVLFYLVFACVLRYNKKLFYTVTGTWALAILVVSFLPHNSFFIGFIFSANFLNFIAGSIIASMTIKYKGIKRYIFLLSAGILVFIFAWINALRIGLDINVNFLYLMSAILIISGLSGIDLNKNIKVSRFFNYLGDAAFAIYLSHTLTISIATKALNMTGLSNVVNPLFVGLTLLVISTLVGCLLHQFIEKPLHKKLKFNKFFSRNRKSRSLLNSN